ncbi:hypothetical protein Arub01_41190 [Actinomadura rubrobrunea]|uniref:histidine kinase n=2 Tax=Actinomadura rubrobrunea TaxID=115335 RepID=A0A9W6PWU6_9ACTN|nr:nitrate- and nitrite sensing domain-containing protein [Actinomadura rubrobrunea]GLW65875.1 hypothetical protein Arub01_41190 [Actinomadura rubrobrunea]
MLVSLAALWAFAAWVTLREGINLLWVTTYDSQLATPTDPLLVELQRERRLSTVYLASPGTAQRQALDAQRARTDKERATVRRLARSRSLEMAADDVLMRRVNEMLAQLDRLDGTRRQIDARTIGRPQVVSFYSEAVESVFRAYDEISALDDEQIAKDTRALLQLNRQWELLSQEDALLVGALTSGRLTAAEHTQFTQLVGARRLNTARALTELQHSDHVLYDGMTKSARLAQVRALEDRVMQYRPPARQSRAANRLPLSAQEWSAVAEPAVAEMRQRIQATGDRLVKRSAPIAVGVILRLVLAGGLGMIAVIASIIVSITTARALVRQLEKLRNAAQELAEERLPGVVQRLEHGEKVDVAAEAPPLAFGTDEIGQVGRAFNAVRETAIRTAVEQAELRRGIRDVLLSLARRTQTLVHRQLSLLDQMERRRDIDPKDLQELFRLDHLATRMRRNAENLIVLSGAIPARGWRRSVPMVDVVRAAVGEVEDYTRVQVLPFGPVELTGRAVGDITHLLAELIENAVSFSPPDTVVQVGGHMVASGFAIDIEDRGLGMTDEKLAEINERIAHPPEFNMQSSVQLGLFVVGKLAERYGVQVSLKRSAYGGTTAVVVIPRELVVEPTARRGGTGPQVVAERTTENGLTVRQPAAVGAASPTSTAERGAGQRSLVAVPSPGSERARSRSAGAGGDGSSDARRAERGADRAEGRDADEPADDRRGGQPTAARPPHDQAPADDAARADDDPTPPEDQRPVPENASTPSGLPVRVPQANLAPPLREEPAPEDAADEEPEDPGRSPEEVLRIMGSYQRGTRRGRDEAARALGTRTAEGEDDQ